MNQLTKKQRQWAWFIGLWFAGLSAVLLMARGIRWLMNV